MAKRRRDNPKPHRTNEVNKRVFVAGMMRTGTMWLARVINKNANVPEPQRHVTHEQSKWCARRLMVRWNTPGLHVEVGHTFAILPELLKRYPDTLLRFIIRDPMPHIESVCSYNGKESDGEALTLAAWNWGSLEAGLRMLEDAGIETKAWHFDSYTSSRGVRAFMDELGIPWDTPFDALADQHNAVPAHKRVVHQEWGDEICEMLMDLWRSNRRVAKLHEEAYRLTPEAVVAGPELP